MRWRSTLVIALLLLLSADASAYRVQQKHPRLLIDGKRLARLPALVAGPLRADYTEMKRSADAAVRAGRIRGIPGQWGIPDQLMDVALTSLVERALRRDGSRYAALVKKAWGDGRMISRKDGSHFGYHALAYDWIYDYLTLAERKRYGDELGKWLRFFTDTDTIILKWGSWWYNQTWGPQHLNIMNSRDAITQKLFIAIAIAGAGTSHERSARNFLASWEKRVPRECVPALNAMGGVWSESMGHGGYGPVIVIPWSFEAWATATGSDLFKLFEPHGYLTEMTKWCVYTMYPHNDRLSYIDDCSGGKPAAYCRAAPFLGTRYRDGLANWMSDEAVRRGWVRARWQRICGYDPTVRPTSPRQAGLPLGYLFRGAGHVYMRSAWDDPEATWVFFGCGPSWAGHSRDDEGHFMVVKGGQLISRQGGQGHNDDDYYAGGSLIFNICTIYDRNEKMRRTKRNENDGGPARSVYMGAKRPHERGRIVAFEHAKEYTYAAADITKGYSAAKAREVTRQLLYLRGRREFLVVFDRVESTRADMPKHFMLHVPDEPRFAGREKTLVPGHVTIPEGRSATWASVPAGDTDIVSKGKYRMFMSALLPGGAEITKRGGKGHDAWGHPDNPDAQYDHTSDRRSRPPHCPWRVEVRAPRGARRAYFLHVFEIAPASQRTMAKAELLKRSGRLGVKIAAGARQYEVTFNPAGPLGGAVKATGAGPYQRNLARGIVLPGRPVRRRR